MPAGDKGAGTWGLSASQREGCGSKRHYRTCQPNGSRYPGGGPRGFYLVRPAIRERDGRNHPRTWARPWPHGSADVWVLSNPEAAGPRPAPPLTRAVRKHPLGSRVPSVSTPLHRHVLVCVPRASRGRNLTRDLRRGRRCAELASGNVHTVFKSTFYRGENHPEWTIPKCPWHVARSRKVSHRP